MEAGAKSILTALDRVLQHGVLMACASVPRA